MAFIDQETRAAVLRGIDEESLEELVTRLEDYSPEEEQSFYRNVALEIIREVNEITDRRRILVPTVKDRAQKILAGLGALQLKHSEPLIPLRDRIDILKTMTGHYPCSL